MSEFRRIQEQWSRWLRDPFQAEPPQGEARRLKVYQRLVHNNIESFITRGFPVLFSTFTNEQEREILQSFIAQHHSKSPLFSEIGAEFTEFLAIYEASWLPEWSYQLALYERMELEVYHYDSACFQPPLNVALDASSWQVNPSLQWHAFDYPVHTIQPDVTPNEPLNQPCYLAVYRVDQMQNGNLESNVKFLQLNAVTMLFVDYLLQCSSSTLAEAADYLSSQLPQFTKEQLYQGLLATVPELYQRAMLFPSSN
ncbi:putative DNA-binding domain-containing protein [Pseudidiomarina marina]|uniref:HvfC family RiPP maturation protein n=1 Tax=Pseudidiomarina marina TaxID=502366 RepID=UPI000C0EA301|nr:MAG: hypothetical protein COA51_05760 [Idiomarina sp.]